MPVFADPAAGERLAKALNQNDAFALNTRWFDGSILLESTDGQVWLKIYRGKVIDHMPFTPPFGYTFKISGADTAWSALADRSRTFADLVTPGVRYFDNDPDLTTLGRMTSEIRIEGNAMEASRLTEAIYLLAETFIETAR